MSFYGLTKVSGFELSAPLSRPLRLRRWAALTSTTCTGRDNRPTASPARDRHLRAKARDGVTLCVYFYGDGRTTRDYVHVSDASSGNIAAASRGAFAATWARHGRETSVLEVTKLLAMAGESPHIDRSSPTRWRSSPRLARRHGPRANLAGRRVPLADAASFPSSGTCAAGALPLSLKEERATCGAFHRGIAIVVAGLGRTPLAWRCGAESGTVTWKSTSFETAVESVNGGRSPFCEAGSADLLLRWSPTAEWVRCLSRALRKGIRHRCCRHRARRAPPDTNRRIHGHHHRECDAHLVEPEQGDRIARFQSASGARPGRSARILCRPTACGST